MSINLLKVGAWAIIGGTTSTAISIHRYNQWLKECGEFNKSDNYYVMGNVKDNLFFFAIGAVAGIAFKLLGIPALQFLGSSSLIAGRVIYNQRENFYNCIKWFFTK